MKKQKLTKTERNKIKSVIDMIEKNLQKTQERYDNNDLTRKQFDKIKKDANSRIKELKKMLRDNTPY